MRWTRRDVLAFGGAIASAAVTSGRTLAQEVRAIPLVGVLNGTGAANAATRLAGFTRGLEESGFADGRNVTLDVRNADGQPPDSFFAELVQRRVSLMILGGGVEYALSKAVAKAGIPVISPFRRDPQKDGFIATPNRPEGNLTGVNQQTAELEGKRLSLLHEAIPGAKTIGYLAKRDGSSPTAGDQIKDAQDSALRLGLSLSVLRADTADEIDAAFATLKERPVDALIVSADPFFASRQDQIVMHVATLRVPTISEWKGFAEAGGLMAYGTSQDALGYQLGLYAALVLRGARISDIPVFRLDSYDFAINQTVAQSFGMTVPQSLLFQATELIQ